MLWVYMDTSVGTEELAGKSPPFIPALSDPDFFYDLCMSDLSYSYESLIENLLDPSHVPFAHHGLQGRREFAKPLDFLVESIGSTGFRGRKAKGTSLGFEALRIYHVKGIWRRRFQEERRLEDRGGMENVEKVYYCPTTADTFVVSYRKWLKKFAGSVPDFGPKASNRLPPSRPKRVVLDRQSLHVEHCTYCSGAVRNFKLLESVLRVLPFVLIGLVAGSNSRPLRGVNGFSIPLLCIAFISVLASRWLQKWIKKNYEFHDYNHALVK